MDTAYIPPQDREEVVRHAVWESVVAVDIDHRPRAENPSVHTGSGHGDSRLARRPLEATLSLRITQYIREHLADPDLSAARIAAAQGLSVRHLHTVLSRSGISLGDWIRTRRLAECRRELAGPTARLPTIAATGRRWGFVDATHFSTVFKQAYGVTPRAWRDQSHADPSA
ncbi:helix-turn-helix domain-containing protein [Streptomyces ziwulingensis]